MSQYARIRRQSAHDKCLDSIDAAATTAVRLTTLRSWIRCWRLSILAASNQGLAIHRCLHPGGTDYVLLVPNHQPVEQPCAGVRRRRIGALCGFWRE